MAKKPPFRKINLLTRKQKDERGLASISEGGNYTIRSRNKIPNPKNPSETLPRGSNVSVAQRTEQVKQEIPVPPKVETKEYQVPKHSFVPGDFQKKVIDRPTTMQLGKSMNENPAKTQARMNAQKEEKSSYNFKGKEEYSGRKETSYKPVTVKKEIPQKPMVVSMPITRKVTNVTKPVVPKSVVVKRSQNFENTPWTGTKKQTKGYTSKPNSGGKTRVKWMGSKVKVN
jgi:hypothetical protein